MKRIITIYLMMLAFVAAANATDYDLKIDGTTVTSSNAADILGNGVFSYNASTNTLQIKGSYTSKTERLVYSDINGLRVVVSGNAVLTVNNGPVFFFLKSGDITSTGRLTIISPNECGIYAVNGASVGIYDSDDVIIQALWGIAGPYATQGEKLTINNSNVDITTSGNGAAAICDFSGGIDLVNCQFTAPDGAYFDVKDLRDKDGNIAKNATISIIGAINAANFPDAKFRAYVKENFDKDKNDFLDQNEIANAKVINVEEKGISDLKGIGHFTALIQLLCSNNNIKSLDLSKNTALVELVCVNNQLTSLNLTRNTELQTMSCAINQLTSLDVTKNTKLTSLSCYSNKLKKLDVTKNTALNSIRCDDNQLTSGDFSKNTKLTYLNCTKNKLTSLKVSDKATSFSQIYIYNNQIGETAMGKFVESLPKVTAEKKIYVRSEQGEDGNVITTTQVAAAKEKGWYVYHLDDGWKLYPGSAPSGIEEVNIGIVTDDRYYTIDGKLVDGVPTKKGIYIHGGKKVVVR